MPEREWDTRVLWLEHRRTWWWNAWHVPTETELFGSADNKAAAQEAMAKAMSSFRGRPVAPLHDGTDPCAF